MLGPFHIIQLRSEPIFVPIAEDQETRRHKQDKSKQGAFILCPIRL